MSMKIMDMQVLIQKTGDVAKIQQTHNQEINLRQQDIANQNVAQTKQNTHSVNQPQGSQGKMVHEKQDSDEKQNKKRNKKGNSGNEANKDENKLSDPDRGNKLDILA